MYKLTVIVLVATDIPQYGQLNGHYPLICMAAGMNSINCGKKLPFIPYMANDQTVDCFQK